MQKACTRLIGRNKKNLSGVVVRCLPSRERAIFRALWRGPRRRDRVMAACRKVPGPPSNPAARQEPWAQNIQAMPTIVPVKVLSSSVVVLFFVLVDVEAVTASPAMGTQPRLTRLSVRSMSSPKSSSWLVVTS